MVFMAAVEGARSLWIAFVDGFDGLDLMWPRHRRHSGRAGWRRTGVSGWPEREDQGNPFVLRTWELRTLCTNHQLGWLARYTRSSEYRGLTTSRRLQSQDGA